MPPVPSVYLAYTGLVNPSGATPVLSREQVWAGLELKVEHAQDFVSAIVSTDVVERREDDQGRKVIVREVVFRADQRRVREVVTLFEPTKVMFLQPDGSSVRNTISFGANGELYMTYDFEWLHPGMSAEDLEAAKKEEAGMSQMAVESSLDAIREMVRDGRIKS